MQYLTVQLQQYNTRLNLNAPSSEAQYLRQLPTTATRNRLGSMLPTTRLNVVVDCDEAISRQARTAQRGTRETSWVPTTATRNRLGSMLPTPRLNVVVDCDEDTSRQRNERVITHKKTRPRVGGSSTKKKKITSLLHYIDMTKERN